MVTDALVALADRAPVGYTDTSGVEEQHRRILVDLALPEDLLAPLMRELRDLVRGIKLVGEATPQARDHLLSFGERCSVRTLAAYFTSCGLHATAVDAYELGLRSDSRFQEQSREILRASWVVSRRVVTPNSRPLRHLSQLHHQAGYYVRLCTTNSSYLYRRTNHGTEISVQCHVYF